ncbi:MAG: cobyrinate a,c-diamide synthase [Piscinibacter sp.]|uniref:cobyrinate a,c-diamide synthase n=1 Tax=Piscinibacter TaxID=1114981 RepID=UPI000FDD4C35|nr:MULTISPECIES: cobyrinate a,c-diamide synthase [Piscinibacter]MCW5665919.1 cobyrinate a,c-diamide synthase [Piscinibacter sp.]
MNPALLVSAAHKSSGKTTLTLGLAAALAARGEVVQPYKKGPDYIDPMWLTRAAGRACVNLDPQLMDWDEIAELFAQHLRGATLGLVEGNKGLYDGLALDGSNSNAALASRLGLPVLLVLDARGMTRGIAPLILGYQAFDRDIRIGGVILNQVGGSRHEAKLRAVIEHYTDVPVLGAVPQDEVLALPERHLGLMPERELGDAAQRVRAMGERIAGCVDLARVRDLAATRRHEDVAAPAADATLRPASEPLRIGIARDKAFGFYYPDDLAALEAEGAELVPFDTLADRYLPPALDGLFIGGGFPELFMDELEANAALRGALQRAIVDGLPVYAECGGLMYLARSIAWNGRRAQMVGVIPGDVVMCKRPVGRGYVRVEETAEFPWQSEHDEPMLRQGHEFHHSRLDNLDPSVQFAYRVQRGHGIDGWHDGVLVHRVLASYTHLRHSGGTDWPRRFVAHLRHVRQLRAEARAAEAPRQRVGGAAWSTP